MNFVSAARFAVALILAPVLLAGCLTMGEIGAPSPVPGNSDNTPVVAIGGTPGGSIESSGPGSAGGPAESPPDNSPIVAMPSLEGDSGLGGLDALVTPLQTLVEGLGESVLQFSPLLPGSLNGMSPSSSSTSPTGGPSSTPASPLQAILGGVGEITGGLLEGIGGVLQSISGSGDAPAPQSLQSPDPGLAPSGTEPRSSLRRLR